MKILRIIVLLVLVAIASETIGFVNDDWSCTYSNVATPDGTPFHCLKSRRPPLYIVQNGNLYLRHCRLKKLSVFLCVIPLQDNWTVEKINNLIADNPELKAMLPDPESKTFGIEWLKKGPEGVSPVNK